MKQLKILGSAVFLLVASSAIASTTWNVAAFEDSLSSTAQAVSISAWSTTGSGGVLASACIHNYDSSGYGIVNTSEKNPCTSEPGTGPHAADNVGGTTDLFLLRFSEAVSLAQVSIGWNGTDNWRDFSSSQKDSDISVLALKSGASFSGNPSNTTLSGLVGTSGAWQVIGNYADVGALSGNATPVTTSVTSSWWIVSAYNSSFGTGTGLDGSNDYFKLLSVAVTTPNGKVSEPAALMLMGAGLIGVMALRRRRQTEV